MINDEVVKRSQNILHVRNLPTLPKRTDWEAMPTSAVWIASVTVNPVVLSMTTGGWGLPEVNVFGTIPYGKTVVPVFNVVVFEEQVGASGGETCERLGQDWEYEGKVLTYHHYIIRSSCKTNWSEGGLSGMLENLRVEGESLKSRIRIHDGLYTLVDIRIRTFTGSDDTA